MNDWYNSLPPITRTYATICFLFTAAVSFGFMGAMQLVLAWPMVLKRFEVRMWITALISLLGGDSCAGSSAMQLEHMDTLSIHAQRGTMAL